MLSNSIFDAHSPQTALSLYADTASHDTGQYFCNVRPFALARSGNAVTMMNCGKEVLQQIHDEMRKAVHTIWIADWQMAFDVELVGRGEPNHPGRLHKVIEDIIKHKAVQVRVLLFGSVMDSIPGTYDGLVARRINSLNAPGYKGSVRVLLQAPTSAQGDRVDYSHHQKFVVVDGSVAFLGGIDLSYGRWETPEFDVVVDPDKFMINEMYSPCTAKLRPPSKREKAEITKWDLAEPYRGKLIDEGCQPRMPWQDVHVKIEGPAAVDVHRNFVRRWNMEIEAIARAGRMAPHFERIDKDWLDKLGAWSVLQAMQQPKPGGALVQIVRSVSSQHLRREGSRPDDLLLYGEAERAAWAKNLEGWKTDHQGNILNAMLNCIRSADNYIYIETQFFVSGFGKLGSVDSAQVGNEDDGIRNMIVDALARRICQHVTAGLPFHVYIVLPGHPEGMITDSAYWKQQWLALASIKHGSSSLVNQIRRALVARNRPPEEWTQYLTCLNLRNFGASVQYARDPETFDEDFSREIGRYVLTEQIYVHSKIMIVDDAVAIVGSANTNDRSLTGNGDTEIAAVIVDTEGVELRDLGSPNFKVQTRKFARELRRMLWTKHFGFMIGGDAHESLYFRSTERARRDNKIVPQDALTYPPRFRTTDVKLEGLTLSAKWASILDKPCAEQTVKAVQAVAAHNARVYESVFLHTPRNSIRTFAELDGFYSLPYPALFGLHEDCMDPRGLPVDPITLLPQTPAIAESHYQQQIRVGGATENYSGVVPPALNPRYMTTNLLSHQRLAARDPHYGRRQQFYPGNTVHDVEKSIKFLRENLVGFFVEMPLDWGMGVVIKGNPTKDMTIDIAATKPLTVVKVG